jgi:hypothetical protein
MKRKIILNFSVRVPFAELDIPGVQNVNDTAPNMYRYR